MKPSLAFDQNRDAIRAVIARYTVRNPRLFGSVAAGLDHEGSDLDLLVEPTAQTTLMDIGAIRFELKKLLGFEVDVLTPNGLPLRFRDQVLREAVPI